MEKSSHLPSGNLKIGPTAYLNLENLEEARLRRHLELSDTERFHKMMRLIRLHLMLKNAKIEHKIKG